MAVAALSLPTAYGGAYRAYFRSTLEIRKVFAIAIGRALVYAAGVVVAVIAGAGLGALFSALSVANLMTFVVVANLLRARVTPGFGFEPAIWRELMRGALPLVANAFAITVSLRIAQVLLMSMRGPVDVGLVSAASRVSESFGILPEALMVTIYPLMAGLHVSDGERLRRTAERSARYLVVAVGVPVTLCAAAGKEIMATLFGAGFAAAGHLLSILAFTALLGAAGTVTVNLLIAVHQERALLRVAMSVAVLGTVVAYFMIREFGVTGAAVAMVISSALSQVALALLPATAKHARPALSAGVRASIAAVAGAASGAALSEHPAVASVVALGVYALTLVLLGVANRDEWEFVRTVVAAARKPA
jgi:O-antigen/teichoic acid export membrane protein